MRQTDMSWSDPHQALAAQVDLTLASTPLTMLSRFSAEVGIEVWASGLRVWMADGSSSRQEAEMRPIGSSIVTIIWIVVGLIVASGHGYLAHLNALTPVLSAILAVLLWPLVLVGISLHIS